MIADLKKEYHDCVRIADTFWRKTVLDLTQLDCLKMAVFLASSSLPDVVYPSGVGPFAALRETLDGSDYAAQALLFLVKAYEMDNLGRGPFDIFPKDYHLRQMDIDRVIFYCVNAMMAFRRGGSQRHLALNDAIETAMTYILLNKRAPYKVMESMTNMQSPVMW